MSGRRITALDVACPSCGATVGARCWRLDGAGECTAHGSRRSRAKQLDAQQNPVHVAGQMPLWGKR